MPATIRRLEYFYATVKDRPGEGYRLLSHLAEAEVNLLAFNAVPIGPDYTQLVLFPENSAKLLHTMEKAEISLTGPQHAFLIQGDDQLGALAEIHKDLFDADIDVYASSGVTDGAGGFGYLLYVRPEHFESAAQVLGI